METAVSESEKRPTSADRCRLTILDLLLLMFSYALGFGISRWLVESRLPNPNALEIVIEGMIYGSGVAAPVVIITQCCLHRRRLRLSLGELLWIAPFVNWTVAVMANRLSGSDTLVMSALWCQAFCSLCGAVLPTIRLAGYWRRVECRWTDLLGSLVCLACGVLVFVGLG